MTNKPPRCIITKLGVVLLVITVLSFVLVIGWQKLATGTFTKGPGWASPTILRAAMLYGVLASLPTLLIGSFVDAYRFGKSKKNEHPEAKNA